MTTKQEKEKQLTDLLGDKELADQVLKQVDAAEKQAQERGLTYKQANDKTAEVETKSDEKKCPNCKEDIPAGAKKCPHCGADMTMTKEAKKDEPDEDDTDGMDEATAKAYKAMLPHIVKTIHALTKASNMEDAAAREAKAAKKEKKEAKAKAKQKELEDKIAQLEATVKELTGDLPRGLASGFRASQSESTILNASALKETAAPPDPLGNFLNGLGMFKQ